MTTIITRLYQDEQTANGVAQSLRDHHFRSKMFDVITKGGDTEAQMTEARVPKGVAEGYAQGINGGNALLVVRAPFGGAQKAGIIVDQTGSISGDSTYVASEPPRQVEDYVLTSHPHIMTSPEFQAVYRGTKFWARFPFDHLIPGHKFQAKFPFGHLIPGHKFQAKFPFAHIVPGHKYMANWIMPHTKV